MKKHTLSAVGKISISSYGDIEVDDVKMTEELAKVFGMNREKYGTTNFAGKVEITILDFTEPLVIDAKEYGRMEE